MLIKTAGVIEGLLSRSTKWTDPTVNWDQARYEEIKAKLTPFIKGAGFNEKLTPPFYLCLLHGGEPQGPGAEVHLPWYK